MYWEINLFLCGSQVAQIWFYQDLDFVKKLLYIPISFLPLYFVILNMSKCSRHQICFLTIILSRSFQILFAISYQCQIQEELNKKKNGKFRFTVRKVWLKVHVIVCNRYKKVERQDTVDCNRFWRTQKISESIQTDKKKVLIQKFFKLKAGQLHDSAKVYIYFSTNFPPKIWLGI